MSDYGRWLAIRAVCKLWSEEMALDPDAPHGTIAYEAFQMILRIAVESETLEVAEHAIAAILGEFDQRGWGDLLRQRLNEAQAIAEGHDEQQSD